MIQYWFRVSVGLPRWPDAARISLEGLVQGVARFAGFGPAEAAEVGSALREMISMGGGADTISSVDLTCESRSGRFEVVVSENGRVLGTIVRRLP